MKSMLLVYSGIAIIGIALVTRQWFGLFWILTGIFLIVLGWGTTYRPTTKKEFLAPLSDPKKKIVVYALVVVIVFFALKVAFEVI